MVCTSCEKKLAKVRPPIHAPIQPPPSGWRAAAASRPRHPCSAGGSAGQVERRRQQHHRVGRAQDQGGAALACTGVVCSERAPPALPASCSSAPTPLCTRAPAEQNAEQEEAVGSVHRKVHFVQGVAPKGLPLLPKVRLLPGGLCHVRQAGEDGSLGGVRGRRQGAGVLWGSPRLWSVPVRAVLARPASQGPAQPGCLGLRRCWIRRATSRAWREGYRLDRLEAQE